MKIAYNAPAILANNFLNKSDNSLAASLSRLSSGLKLVNAKDNPAGLAMARRMDAQLEGISVATQNAGDAISVISIADGAMSEVHDIMQRINELTVKACNGTMLDDDRKLIQDEVAALQSEITRISETTEFNGKRVLDGSFDLRGYTNTANVKAATYSDDVSVGTYNLDLVVGFDADNHVDPAATTFTNVSGFPAGSAISAVDGNTITISDGNGFEIKLEAWQAGTYTNVEVEVTGTGSMDMQIGANEGQQLNIRIRKLSLENMGISNIDLSTEAGAREALDKMEGAINYISSSRSQLGAYQNRLEHTINNLDITTENMTAAYSRIMDTDMAEEMTNYTTLQVLSQASTTMMAQANERPAQVLQLLQ